MNHDKHLALMLVCCLIPVALFVAVGVFGLALGSSTLLLPLAMVLLCPLLMFFMMRGMMDEHGPDHGPREAAVRHDDPRR